MNIYEKLKKHPLMNGLTFNSVSPVGTGLFPQGIVRCSFDVTGGAAVVKKYILRRRDKVDSGWVADAFRYLMGEGYAVGGGKLVSPTGDGFGTWEMEFEVTETTGGI